MLWAAALPALAGDVWVGGGVSGGIALDGSEVVPENAQVEVDFRYAGGPLYIRVDADLHWLPGNPSDEGEEDPNAIPGLPLPPEWAIIRLAGESAYVQAGVTNPAIGLQYWDEWDNYLPTFTQSWGFQPSQIIGVEGGITSSGGYTPSVWGGYDMGWFAPNFGVGLATEQDLWSTWSGVFAYPIAFDCGDAGGGYYGATAALEFYPADALTLSLDGTGGLMCGSSFVSGSLWVSVLPEAIVAPVLRLEGTMDRDELLVGNSMAASVGAHVWPLDWLWIGVEEKVTVAGEGPANFRSTLMVGLRRSEPEDGMATYEEAE